MKIMKKFVRSKFYIRGNLGATEWKYKYIPPEFIELETMGEEIEKILENLRDEDERWTVSIEKGEIIFENDYLDSDGNSWGRAHIIYTEAPEKSQYDTLVEELKRHTRFDVIIAAQGETTRYENVPVTEVIEWIEESLTAVSEILLYLDKTTFPAHNPADMDPYSNIESSWGWEIKKKGYKVSIYEETADPRNPSGDLTRFYLIPIE